MLYVTLVPPGPTFDWLLNKYNGNFDDIVSAACRPNPDVDALLGGLNHG